MNRHFEQAIRPLILTASLFGFALTENPAKKKGRFLSLLYAAVSCGLQIGFQSIKGLYLKPTDGIFVDSISNNVLVCMSFTTFILIFSSQWNGKTYYRCLAAIHEVDGTLRGLGIQTNYSKLRRVVMLALVTWLSWMFILNVMDTFSIPRDYDNTIQNKLLILIFDISVHASMLIDVHFWCVVGYAGTRFDCINSALREFTLDDNDYMGRSPNNQVTFVRRAFILNEKNKRIIWTVMHLHFRLCEILREITRAFEAQIYMEIAFSFYYVLCSIIFTFRVILLHFEGDKFKYCVLIWVWTFGYILKIVVTICICESVAAKAMRVNATIIGLLHIMDDVKMREDVLLMGLRTKQKPLTFPCLGLYYFEYKFLCEIFSSMVTMIVIILQLKTGLRS